MAVFDFSKFVDNLQIQFFLWNTFYFAIKNSFAILRKNLLLSVKKFLGYLDFKINILHNKAFL